MLSKLPVTRHLELKSSHATNIVVTSRVPTHITIHELSGLVQSVPTIREIIIVSYEPDVFSGANYVLENEILILTTSAHIMVEDLDFWKN